MMPEQMKNQSHPLARIQRKVYAAFAGGAKLTAADISIITHCSDPRTHIRSLRHKGIEILDEWRNSDDGVRYKVYWLASGNVMGGGAV
jgi:hypothetical protein